MLCRSEWEKVSWLPKPCGLWVVERRVLSIFVSSWQLDSLQTVPSHCMDEFDVRLSYTQHENPSPYYLYNIFVWYEHIFVTLKSTLISDEESQCLEKQDCTFIIPQNPHVPVFYVTSCHEMNFRLCLIFLSVIIDCDEVMKWLPKGVVSTKLSCTLAIHGFHTHSDVPAVQFLWRSWAIELVKSHLDPMSSPKAFCLNSASVLSPVAVISQVTSM